VEPVIYLHVQTHNSSSAILLQVSLRQRIRYGRNFLVLPQDRGLGTDGSDAEGVDLRNLVFYTYADWEVIRDLPGCGSWYNAA
jgi:hypothetical protein